MSYGGGGNPYYQGNPGAQGFASTFGSVMQAYQGAQAMKMQQQQHNLEAYNTMGQIINTDDPATAKPLMDSYIRNVMGGDPKDPDMQAFEKSILDNNSTLHQSMQTMLGPYMDKTQLANMPPQMMIQMAKNPSSVISFIQNMAQLRGMGVLSQAAQAASGVANPTNPTMPQNPASGPMPNAPQSTPGGAPGAMPGNPVSPMPSPSTTMGAPQNAPMAVSGNTTQAPVPQTGPTGTLQQPQDDIGNQITNLRRAATIASGVPGGEGAAANYLNQANSLEAKGWGPASSDQISKEFPKGIAAGTQVQANRFTGELKVTQAPAAGANVTFGAESALQKTEGETAGNLISTAMQEGGAARATAASAAIAKTQIASMPAGLFADQRQAISVGLNTLGFSDLASKLGNATSGDIVKAMQGQQGVEVADKLTHYLGPETREIVQDNIPELTTTREGIGVLQDVRAYNANVALQREQLASQLSNNGANSGKIISSMSEFDSQHQELPAPLQDKLVAIAKGPSWPGGTGFPIEQMNPTQLNQLGSIRGSLTNSQVARAAQRQQQLLQGNQTQPQAPQQVPQQ